MNFKFAFKTPYFKHIHVLLDVDIVLFLRPWLVCTGHQMSYLCSGVTRRRSTHWSIPEGCLRNFPHKTSWNQGEHISSLIKSFCWLLYVELFFTASVCYSLLCFCCHSYIAIEWILVFYQATVLNKLARF